MTHTSSTRWRTLATVGLGLGAAAAVVAVIGNARRARSSGSHDSAPDYTARHTEGSGETTGRTVTIRKPRTELFQFWRDLTNLPHFMENLERIEPGTPEGANTWFVKGPMGKVFEIETRVDREIENEMIAWKSTEGSEVKTEWRVTFEDAPGDRGTRVSLIITYDQPAGTVDTAIAKLMGLAPAMQARHDLKRFRMLMETGEIATSARCKDAGRAPTMQTEEIA